MISLLAVAPVAVLAVDGRSKIVLARRLRRLVPRAVAAYAPDFVVYTSRPDDASYQVMMWLPYLQRAGLRFIIVARNAVPAAVLAELTDVPVVEARGIADLDALVVPSLKAAFYVNASSGNGALVRFQHLTHIYLGHGDSDKPPSYNPTHAMYDQILPQVQRPPADMPPMGCGSRAKSSRSSAGRRSRTSSRARLASQMSRSPRCCTRRPGGARRGDHAVLAAVGGADRVALLTRGATVIFRPHPFSYDFPDDATTIARIIALLEADRRKTGRPHLWGAAAEKDRSILDCINDSDAMVSDVSSVVSDYLFSSKPFAMIAVPAEPEAFVAEYPIARASYVIRADLADLDAQLEKMLGLDPLAGQRPTSAPTTSVTFRPTTMPRRLSMRFTMCPASPWRTWRMTRPTMSQRSRPAEMRTKSQLRRRTVTALPGRSWSKYAQIAARVGLDLAGTAIALIALAVALAGGPSWLTALFATVSVWAAFQSVAGTVIRPDRWPRLLTEGDATRAVLVVTLAVTAHNADQLSWQVAATCGMLLIAIVVERRIRMAWSTALLGRNLPDALRDLSDVIPRGLLPIMDGLLIIISFLLILGGASDDLAGTDWPCPSRCSSGHRASAATANRD